MSDDIDRVMEIIKSRRSIRRFTPKEVEKEKIEIILESARWAPSAGNTQPWEFVIVRDPKRLGNLKMFMPGVMGNMELGPVLLCICLNLERQTMWSKYDLGCALQNILLTAHVLGLGACAIGGFEETVTRDILNLPENVEPCLFVAIGYPVKAVPVPSRRNIDEMLLREFN